MLQLLPGGLGHGGKADSGPARKSLGWDRRGPAVLALCLVLHSHRDLGGAVLVAQAGAAPVQPQLLPRGFPLPDRSLLIRGGDAQGWPLAPAAQARLGRHKGGEVTRVGYGERGGNIPIFVPAAVPAQCQAGNC